MKLRWLVLFIEVSGFEFLFGAVSWGIYMVLTRWFVLPKGYKYIWP